MTIYKFHDREIPCNNHETLCRVIKKLGFDPDDFFCYTQSLSKTNLYVYVVAKNPTIAYPFYKRLKEVEK